jgi:hypothetical protein
MKMRFDEARTLFWQSFSVCGQVVRTTTRNYSSHVNGKYPFFNPGQTGSTSFF